MSAEGRPRSGHRADEDVLNQNIPDSLKPVLGAARGVRLLLKELVWIVALAATIIALVMGVLNGGPPAIIDGILSRVEPILRSDDRPSTSAPEELEVRPCRRTARENVSNDPRRQMHRWLQS